MRDFGFCLETHSMVNAALKLWAREQSAAAEPGTPEADPAYWWNREAGGMG